MARAWYHFIFLWGLLLALTAISSESMAALGIGSDYGGAVVLVLAFIKVRIVVLDFMEIRRAPLFLRALLEVWIVGICGLLITMSIA